MPARQRRPQLIVWSSPCTSDPFPSPQQTNEHLFFLSAFLLGRMPPLSASFWRLRGRLGPL
jgi:hypothetical protein